jgi:hypothetical protein
MNAQKEGAEVFNLGARFGWVMNTTPRPFYPRKRDPVFIAQEAGYAPGPVWTGAENLAPTATRFPGPSSP